MTITGNVGRVICVRGLGLANINQHIARIRIRDSGFDTGFVYQYLSQKSIREHYETITTGQAYPQISLAQVRDTVIVAPPVQVQRRIARALDDADSLIASIGLLIAKKQVIKQGVMQQLLTGKTRLSGFSQPWQDFQLGDVARIKTGTRNNQDKESFGRYPFFVRSATVERIDTYSYDCEAILVPGEGGIGSIYHYINGKFEVHQRVYAISHFNSDVSGKFVYFYLRQFFGLHAMENSVRATVDSLRLPTFKGFRMTMPARLEEQEAIATVLTDIDDTIKAFQARLNKAKAIKQGMMQELLTGRTRLPLKEPAA